MITDSLWAILSLLVILVGTVTHPHRAQCPPGFYVEGIRPSGAFSCHETPVGDDHRNTRGILVDDSKQSAHVLVGDIYCTGGSRPIVVSDRIVGCQQEAWSE